MRNLNLSRRSFASSITLRALTALVIVLAPAAAYAATAKGPCTTAQSYSDEGRPPCLYGSYGGTRVIKYFYSTCAGISENNDCTPDLIPNKLIRQVLLYTTQQSVEQASAQAADAAAISQALAECTDWAEGLAGVTLGVTIVGGVATIVGGIATWLFPAAGATIGTAAIISGVVTITGAIAAYNVNATLAQCQQQYTQQMAQHQQRINSCYYVSRKETLGATQRADSCQ